MAAEVASLREQLALACRMLVNVGSRFTELGVDCADPARVAAFWCDVLGWRDPEGNEFCLLRRRLD